MKRFDYMVVKHIIRSKKFLSISRITDTGILEQSLRAAGSEGWELVSSVVTQANGWSEEYIMTFKREIAALPPLPVLPPT